MKQTIAEKFAEKKAQRMVSNTPQESIAQSVSSIDASLGELRKYTDELILLWKDSIKGDPKSWQYTGDLAALANELKRIGRGNTENSAV